MKTNKKQSLIWWDKRLFFIIIDFAFLYTDWYNIKRQGITLENYGSTADKYKERG